MLQAAIDIIEEYNAGDLSEVEAMQDLEALGFEMSQDTFDQLVDDVNEMVTSLD